MSKIYLLLRNNRQCGPFDLQELLAQELKPLDLVFVEGKSFGWSYPSEIDSLKPFLPPPEQKTNAEQSEELKQYQVQQPTNYSENLVPKKTVYVSLPQVKKPHAETRSVPQKVVIKEHIPALQQPVIQSPTTTPNEPVLETKYTKSIDDIGEDYSAWLYNNRIKKKNSNRSKQVATATVLLIIIAGGLWAASSIMNKAEEKTSGDNNLTNTTTPPAVINQAEENIEPIKATEQTRLITYPNKKKTVSSSLRKEAERPNNNNEKNNQLVLSDQPEVNEETTILSDEPEAEKSNPSTDKPKKKTLGQAIEGFIDKLAGKDEESTTEEPSGKSTTTDTGERQSNKRGESKTQTDGSIVNQVHLSSDQPTDNWMSGIQGVNISLKNQSNRAIKLAVVEIGYYDADNKLLDKKNIEFRNIPANSGQRLPAPAHRSADHIDYKLLSIELKENKLLKSF